VAAVLSPDIAEVVEIVLFKSLVVGLRGPRPSLAPGHQRRPGVYKELPELQTAIVENADIAHRTLAGSTTAQTRDPLSRRAAPERSPGT